MAKNPQILLGYHFFSAESRDIWELPSRNMLLRDCLWLESPHCPLMYLGQQDPWNFLSRGGSVQWKIPITPHAGFCPTMLRIFVGKASCQILGDLVTSVLREDRFKSRLQKAQEATGWEEEQECLWAFSILIRAVVAYSTIYNICEACKWWG